MDLTRNTPTLAAEPTPADAPGECSPLERSNASAAALLETLGRIQTLCASMARAISEEATADKPKLSEAK